MQVININLKGELKDLGSTVFTILEKEGENYVTQSQSNLNVTISEAGEKGKDGKDGKDGAMGDVDYITFEEIENLF